MYLLIIFLYLGKIKHIKPQQKNEVGRIITIERPIDCSNIMLCYGGENVSRIGLTVDDTKPKYQKISRIIKKTGEIIS